MESTTPPSIYTPRLEGGALHVTNGAGEDYLLFDEDMTARIGNVFRNQRDTEIGRRRWATNPDYVTYHDAEWNEIRVINERTGDVRVLSITYLDSPADSVDSFFAAALAHLDTIRPLREWHNAQVGDVWLVSIRGADPVPHEVQATNQGPRFVRGDERIPLTSTTITDAEILWAPKRD